MTKTTDPWRDAYHRMLDRTTQRLFESREKTLTSLGESIEFAQHKAVELEELSIEEADKLAQYLRRDVHDAAEFMLETQQDLAAWLRFDLNLLEDTFLNLFTPMVDHTRDALTELASTARANSHWYTGEITGAGTLHCVHCQHDMHFHTAGKIPPCPHCEKTQFTRLWTHEA